MVRAQKAHTFVLLVFTMLVAVVACGGNDASGPDSTPLTTSPAVTTVSSDTTDTAPETTTASLAPVTTVEPTTTSEPEPESDPMDAACLVGEWTLRSQDFFDQVVLLVGEDAAGTSFEHLSGTYRLVLGADGTGVATREAWTFRVQTDEGALVSTITSVDTASFAIDGDVMTYEESGDSEGEIILQTEIDGQLVPLPPFGRTAGGPGTEAYAGSGPYTCTSDELTLTITDDLGTITARWDRA